MPKGNCQFNGNGGQYFGTVFIHLFLLSSITLGLYSAWAWAKLFRLKASHTIINGKSVSFAGTGGQLFPLILIQGLITIVTLGFYFPWAICKFFRWRAENTLVGGKPCQFTGTGGSFFIFYLIHLMILPMVTLGIYYFWGLYRFYAWKEEHTKYGGEKTSFGASLGGFFKVSLISYILNAITLNIFAPWSICMLFKWQIEGLAVGDGEEVEHFSPVKTNVLVVAILVIIGLIPFLALGFLIKTQWENIQMMRSQMAQMQTLAGKKEKTYKVVKKSADPAKKTAEKPLPKKTSPTKKAVDYTPEMKRLNNLIKLDNKNADAFYNRGWLYASKGNLQMAEKDYSKAVEVNKKYGDAYYNRGLILVKMKKYDQAVRDFSEAIKLKSRSVDAYCNRGNAYYQLGKLDLAINDYGAALKIYPNDTDLIYNRAIVYLAGGEKKKAIVDFEKAAELGHSRAKMYLKIHPVK